MLCTMMMLLQAQTGMRIHLDTLDLESLTFVDTVIFFVGEENWISQRAMEKIGGIRRAALVPREIGGKAHGHVVFEICKSDWQTATPG